MTKREKILLQICLAIALIGFSSVYLLKPSISEKKEQAAALEAVKLEELQINAVLEAEGVDEKLAEQMALAEENYGYFYDKLNTYTIDEILNERIASCGLEIEGMSIGKYVEIGTDTLRRTVQERTAKETAVATESASGTAGQTAIEENLLLGCQVSLTVEGTYSEVLALVDALREESTCIEVSSVNLYANERNVEEDEAIKASLGLLVYGVSDAMLKEDAG